MQKRKVLSLEWKSEGVMDDESGEFMELVSATQCSGLDRESSSGWHGMMA